MVKLSNRLSHLADLVTKGNVLADIGTDHGYIPIYLIEQRRIPKAFAMDIGKGPLERAQQHITESGLGGYITLRLSDGLQNLEPNEAGSILIAGMGGGLVLHILEQGEAVAQSADELILQPQSEIEKVREYLDNHGYYIDKEDIVFEEGKYYPMMHVIYQGGSSALLAEEKQVCYRYGEKLLKENHNVLKQYLLFLKEQYSNILKSLCQREETEAIQVRMHEVREELSCIQAGLSYWKDGVQE